MKLLLLHTRWLGAISAAGGLASAFASSPEGSVTATAFFSATLGQEIRYQVYHPAGYPDGADRYPVLYLLHGRGDTFTAWLHVKPDLDRLIAAGLIPPLIAIMPDAPSSRRAGYYIDSEFAPADPEAPLPAGEKVESAFTADLIAHVDATYRTVADRTGRLVGGYSMGGYGALRYVLAHPRLFRGALVLSPAVYHPLPPSHSSTREFGAFGRGDQVFVDAIYREKNYPALVPGFSATGLSIDLFIAVGDDEGANPDPEDAIHDLDYEAHTLYNRLRRVPHIRAELRVINGRHNWNAWQRMFVEGIQHLFANPAAGPP